MTKTRRTWAAVAFVLVLAAGAALRLSFGHDIEYKYDEAWMFEQARGGAAGGPWPELGMPSGVGVRNPAMSVWVFIGLAKLFGTESPVELARAVQWLNCAALALLGWFAWKRARGADREAWFWGAALAAVNPIAVILQRKIWAQSTLPLLSMVFLIGVWSMESAWGAFLMGFAGTIAGQIHMSGFFYLAAFMGWLVLTRRGEWRWGWTLLGIMSAVPPMIPWIRMVLSGQEHHSEWAFTNIRKLDFFRMWIENALAMDFKYSLGDLRQDFYSFPEIAETPTRIVSVLWLASITTGGIILFRSLYWRFKRLLANKRSSHDTRTGLLIRGGFWCYGLLMTVAPFPLHQHYLLIAFPLPFVWLARSGLRPVSLSSPGLGRALLAICVVTQLGLSILFLDYIHERGGAPGADYGVTYSVQKDRGSLPSVK